MYSTISVAESAYLVAKGFEVQSLTDQRNTRIKAFVFEPEAAKVAPEFYANEPVNAYDFHIALQTVRRMIRLPREN